MEPKVCSFLSRRLEGQPRWIKELSWRAQIRLNYRFTRLRQRLMQHNKIKVAVARELIAFIWELGIKLQGRPSGTALSSAN
jgi:transposase